MRLQLLLANLVFCFRQPVIGSIRGYSTILLVFAREHSMAIYQVVDELIFDKNCSLGGSGRLQADCHAIICMVE